jgi:hypothetical protein
MKYDRVIKTGALWSFPMGNPHWHAGVACHVSENGNFVASFR